ncbi:replicative DNA helicase [Vogesella sp. XCS3]|uniref:replicative DNA helicase n=1 Tax=Vogesella sp. XCS3 TaxID=2877939 RepID=UPI001D0A6671|nr:replicative DNA helicase [Vogesella sp. XCS3]UDM18902.1 replicative DNA helicase [Vogesella sp. XCS3]
MPPFDETTQPPDYLAEESGQYRVPPHSIEAEQSVLGGLMLDNEAWDRIADKIAEGDFYRHDHRLIFRHIGRLIEANQPADVVTVAESLTSTGDLEGSGGIAYLASMAQNTPSAANIKRYAEIIRERSIMRSLAQASQEIQTSVMNPEGRDAATLLDDAQARMMTIADSAAKAREGFRASPEILKNVIARIDELYSRDNPDDVTGVPTGFADIDKKTSGFQPGDLIIVAGRPSMGKTAFSMNIAENVCIEAGLPVAVFSMEMSEEQLMTRMLSSVGRIDAEVLKTGRLQDDDWQKLTYATARLSDAPLFIDESPALTVLDLKARARRLARQHGGRLGLIVVDYLQLMSGDSDSGQNRNEVLGTISRGLKSLAKELKCPVVALSQLSRNVESRPNKRPIMSDIRESGAIEQDADIIIFMYRDEYYNPDSDQKGVAEAIFGKYRNGATGTVRLAFVGNHSRFENYAFSGPYGNQFE